MFTHSDSSHTCGSRAPNPDAPEPCPSSGLSSVLLASSEGSSRRLGSVKRSPLSLSCPPWKPGPSWSLCAPPPRLLGRRPRCPWASPTVSSELGTVGGRPSLSQTRCCRPLAPGRPVGGGRPQAWEAVGLHPPQAHLDSHGEPQVRRVASAGGEQREEEGRGSNPDPKPRNEDSGGCVSPVWWWTRGRMSGAGILFSPAIRCLHRFHG